MQKFYAERDTSGPEFDDKLIRLVRTNPAIYDVNHPHYRRNPVRVAIWDRIATELGSPSKFIQTKWKNIRYNYLQEIKCIETGFPNANIRKRRFTEDLSFLQNTAQVYTNTKRSIGKNSTFNGSDNESNSYMFPDPVGDAYEIIEIDHSDDGGDDEEKRKSLKNISSNDVGQTNIETNKENPNGKLNAVNSSKEPVIEPKPDVTIEQTFTRKKSPNPTESFAELEEPPAYCFSNSSSPLLTPLVVMGNGLENESNGFSDEVTIEPILKSKINVKRFLTNSTNAMMNDSKQKMYPTPFSDMPMNDPIELYCLSLADTLRSMPRSERERVKFEFAKILKDAKYKDQS